MEVRMYPPEKNPDQYQRTVTIAFCLGLLALAGLIIMLCGCAPAPLSHNYTAIAELALAEYEKPPEVKVDDCPCNGTKKVGDGDNAVPCPCGIHCPCLPKEKPKEVIKHPSGTALTCPCNGQGPCPCGTNCMCQLLRDHKAGKIVLPPGEGQRRTDVPAPIIQNPPVVTKPNIAEAAPSDRRVYSNPPRRRGLFRVR